MSPIWWQLVWGILLETSRVAAQKSATTWGLLVLQLQVPAFYECRFFLQLLSYMIFCNYLRSSATTELDDFIAWASPHGRCYCLSLYPWLAAPQKNPISVACTPNPPSPNMAAPFSPSTAAPSKILGKNSKELRQWSTSWSDRPWHRLKNTNGCLVFRGKMWETIQWGLPFVFWLVGKHGENHGEMMRSHPNHWQWCWAGSSTWVLHSQQCH